MFVVDVWVCFVYSLWRAIGWSSGSINIVNMKGERVSPCSVPRWMGSAVWCHKVGAGYFADILLDTC